MNCIGLFVRLQVLHMIVGEITSTVYDCWRDYEYCVGLLARLQVLCRIVGEITSTV